MGLFSILSREHRIFCVLLFPFSIFFRAFQWRLFPIDRTASEQFLFCVFISGVQCWKASLFLSLNNDIQQTINILIWPYGKWIFLETKFRIFASILNGGHTIQTELAIPNEFWSALVWEYLIFFFYPHDKIDCDSCVSCSWLRILRIYFSRLIKKRKWFKLRNMLADTLVQINSVAGVT